MKFFKVEAAEEKNLLLLLRLSSEDQTTTLPDGELTRHRVIELFYLDVDFFLSSWTLLKPSNIRMPIACTSSERK